MYIVAYRLINLRNTSGRDSTDAYIAEVLLENINEIDQMSIEKVAELCSISKSKLSKFVKKIGFDDYKEFRDLVKNEKYRSGYYGYEDKLPMGRYMAREGWDSYIQILRRDLDCLTDRMDMNMVRTLAAAIHKHTEVAAFGSVYSQTVAIDFMYRMAEEGKIIRTYTYDLAQEDYMKNMDEDTLVIIFSNSGQYLYGDGMRLQGYFKTYLKRTKGEIALITSNEEAASDPIVKYPILYTFATNVHGHPLAERLVMELIISEYKKLG
nr:MurR/RpiR family transcriptional regulator [uncultured Mediterraneibacter sp.]